MNQNNELYHYGVPGMRWGHRKARAEQRNVERARKTIDKYKGDKIKAIKSVRRKSSLKRAAVGAVGGTASVATSLTGLSLAAQAAAGAAVAPAMPLVLGGAAAAALTRAGQAYMKRNAQKQEEYIIKSK